MPNPRRVNLLSLRDIRVALVELAQSSFVPGIVCGVVLCLLLLAAFAGLQRWEESANLKFEISEAEPATPAQVGCVRSWREPACIARGSVARLSTLDSQLTTSFDLLHRPHVRSVRHLLSTAAVPATNGPATFSQHGYATTCKAQLVGERFDNGHAADLGVCRYRLEAWDLGLEGEPIGRNSHAADLGICKNTSLYKRETAFVGCRYACACRPHAAGRLALCPAWLNDALAFIGEPIDAHGGVCCRSVRA